MNFKYARIQGRELASFTEYPNGIFGIFRDFEEKNIMTEEDKDLFNEINDYFVNKLPWPPMCNERQKVVCFFKTENADEMMKYAKPLMWLLERYNHPYDIVYTNFPGEIIYEDDYQVVVKVDSLNYTEIDYIKDDIFSREKNQGVK